MTEVTGEKSKGVRARYIRYIEYLKQNEFNAAVNDPEMQRSIDGYYRGHLSLFKSYNVRDMEFYII